VPLITKYGGIYNEQNSLYYLPLATANILDFFCLPEKGFDDILFLVET